MDKLDIWYSVEIVYKGENRTSVSVYQSKQNAIDLTDQLCVRARVYPFKCSDGISLKPIYDNNNSNFAF